MGDVSPAVFEIGGYGSTDYFWRLVNMITRQSSPLPMKMQRSLCLKNCNLRICEIGSNVFVHVNWIGTPAYRDWETDRKSTRLNSSH